MITDRIGLHSVLLPLLITIIIIITISNGNRTEYATATDRIGLQRIAGVPFVYWTSMITDQIGRREVLLPINHTVNKFVIYKALFLI